MRHPNFLATLVPLATCSLLGSLLVAETALAAEGRTEIATPTTISAPGHYIVTANITATVGAAVLISAKHVDLDLNGRTLSTTATGGSIIEISSAADDVRIYNGHLGSAYRGIYAPASPGLTLVMERLVIEGVTTSAIELNGAAHVELGGSQILNAASYGLIAYGVSGEPITGSLVRNSIGGSAYCIAVVNLGPMLVKDNVLTGCGTALQLGTVGTAPAGSGSGGAIVTGNTVRNSNAGISLEGSARGSQVLGNTAQECGIGILVNARGSRIAENLISRSRPTLAIGTGIHVSGAHNLLEGNLVEGSAACGLLFSGTTAARNVFRNNVFRDNVGGAVCYTNGAIPIQAVFDGGGNIL